MSFTSLKALCKEFGLPSDMIDIENIRTELQRLRVEIHPDKNGGVPINEDAKLQFQRLSEAIEYLDNLPQAMERFDPRVSSIEERLTMLQSAFEASRPEQEIRTGSVKALHSMVAGRYRGKLIGSGSLFAICAAILGFSERLPTNPVFAPIANSRSARLSILIAFLGTGVAFCWNWIRERRLQQKLNWMLTDDGLAHVMRMCIEDSGKEQHLTKRLIADHILYIEFPWHRFKSVRWLKKLLWVGLTRDLSERVAEIHLRILLGRGVVRRGGLKGLEPLFVMDAARAKEIENDR